MKMAATNGLRKDNGSLENGFYHQELASTSDNNLFPDQNVFGLPKAVKTESDQSVYSSTNPTNEAVESRINVEDGNGLYLVQNDTRLLSHDQNTICDFDQNGDIDQSCKSSKPFPNASSPGNRSNSFESLPINSAKGEVESHGKNETNSSLGCVINSETGLQTGTRNLTGDLRHVDHACDVGAEGFEESSWSVLDYPEQFNGDVRPKQYKKPFPKKVKTTWDAPKKMSDSKSVKTALGERNMPEHYTQDLRLNSQNQHLDMGFVDEGLFHNELNTHSYSNNHSNSCSAETGQEDSKHPDSLSRHTHATKNRDCENKATIKTGLTITEYGAGSNFANSVSNETAMEEDFIEADIPSSNLYFDKDSTSSEEDVLDCSVPKVNVLSDNSALKDCQTELERLAISENLLNSNCDRENQTRRSSGCDGFNRHANISTYDLVANCDMSATGSLPEENFSHVKKPFVHCENSGKNVVPENRNFDNNNLNVRDSVKSVILQGHLTGNDLGNDADDEDDDNLSLLSPTETSVPSSSLVMNSVADRTGEQPPSCIFKKFTLKTTTSTLVNRSPDFSDISDTVLPTTTDACASLPDSGMNKNQTLPCNKSPQKNVVRCYDHVTQVKGQDSRTLLSTTTCKLSSLPKVYSSSSSGEESPNEKTETIKRDKCGRRIYPKPEFDDPLDQRHLPKVEYDNQMSRLRARVWKQKGKAMDYNVCCTGVPHYPKIPRSQRCRSKDPDSDESTTDEEYYEPVPQRGTKDFIRYHNRRCALAEEKNDKRTSCECELCKLKNEDYAYNVEDFDKPWPDYIESIILKTKDIEKSDKKRKPCVTNKDSTWSSERNEHYVPLDAHSVSGCMERKLLDNIDGFQERGKYDKLYHCPTTFIWDEEEVRNIQVSQIGVSACGPTAAINVLKAFGYEISPAEINSLIPVKRRREKSTVTDYLLSRSCAGTTARDIIDGIEKATNGEIAGRFFSTFPERNFKIKEFLAYWYNKGAACILTLNLQRGRMWGRPIPDAWHHQMVYGVNSSGVHLTNPVEYMTDYVLHNKLNSDSVLLVRSSDIINRWQSDACDLHTLMHVPSDRRWTDMNVLGQVINVMRAKSHPNSRPVDIPSHVTIPAVYEAGISLFALRSSRTYHALMKMSELPLLTPEDGVVYEYDEYSKEPSLFDNVRTFKYPFEIRAEEAERRAAEAEQARLGDITWN